MRGGGGILNRRPGVWGAYAHSLLASVSHGCLQTATMLLSFCPLPSQSPILFIHLLRSQVTRKKIKKTINCLYHAIRNLGKF